MKSFLLSVLILVLATETINALWCHTCVDYRPWPALNSTAEVQGALSSCRQGVQPSPLFLRKCQLETEVCGQIFFDGLWGGEYMRFASRSCVDLEALGIEQGEDMNKCVGGEIDMSPWFAVGPGMIIASFCNEDACNPCINGTTDPPSRKMMPNVANLMKQLQF